MNWFAAMLLNGIKKSFTVLIIFFIQNRKLRSQRFNNKISFNRSWRTFTHKFVINPTKVG